MDWPIYFNYQANGVTIEIYNEASNDLLAAEVQASQAIRA